MIDFVKRATRVVKDDLSMGFIHAFGADPVSNANGVMSSSFMGRELLFEGGTGMPKLGGKLPYGALNAGLNAFTAGTALYDTYQGYQENGVVGGARALTQNAALNASIIKHAYRLTNNAGIMEYSVGRAFSSARIAKMGKAAKMGAHAANFADFGARTVMGSILGGIPGQIFGGGIMGALSTPLSVAGSNIGVRYGPRLMAGALVGGAVLGGGYLAAKGVGSVLRAGYEHTQSRKQLNTDGDMTSFMTQSAFTMRGKAVQAISKSHMNARSALGQEANLMSMPSRNYHSMYKRY